MVPRCPACGDAQAGTARSWLFINTDLTVLLHRHPAGAWVCMESRTTIDADGIGATGSRT